MENDNFVDNSAQKVYDKVNDADEVIRMAGKIPDNDPKCQHELVLDPTDRIGNFVAHVCHKCGVGKFLPDENKNPS